MIEVFEGVAAVSPVLAPFVYIIISLLRDRTDDDRFEKTVNGEKVLIKQ